MSGHITGGTALLDTSNLQLGGMKFIVAAERDPGDANAALAGPRDVAACARGDPMRETLFGASEFAGAGVIDPREMVPGSALLAQSGASRSTLSSLSDQPRGSIITLIGAYSQIHFNVAGGAHSGFIAPYH
jgi:hypothetical protein